MNNQKVNRSRLIFVGAGKSTTFVEPAENLADWYKNQFQLKSDDVASDTTAELTGALEELASHFLSEKEDAESTIASFRDQQTDIGQAGIENHQGEIQRQLALSVADLSKGEFEVEKQKIAEELEEDISSLLIEMFGN